SQLAGPDATGGERRFRVGEEVPGAEALEVVVVHGGSWLLVGAGPVGRECNGCTRGQGVRRSTGQPAGRCRRVRCRWVRCRWGAARFARGRRTSRGRWPALYLRALRPPGTGTLAREGGPAFDRGARRVGARGDRLLGGGEGGRRP